MTSASTTRRRLNELARSHGVQLGYTAQDGSRVTAPRDTVRALLAALGHPVSTAAEVDAEHEASLRARHERMLEPVAVLDHHGRLSRPVVLPVAADLGRAEVTIRREDGAMLHRPLSEVVAESPTVRRRDHVERTIDLSPLALPPGYHHLDLAVAGHSAHTLLLAPPARPRRSLHGFGVFAPVYALRGRNDWGVGSFTDLGEFADLVGRWGGDLAGTLPLFAAFLDEPVDPSPYLPVSRRFWNELFVDVDRLPELETSPAARDLVGSDDLRRELRRLRRRDDVDYAAVARLKRRVLEECARSLGAEPSDRREEFQQFAKAHPDLDRYAEFRAAGEATGSRWPAWQSQPGRLPDADLDAGSRYHRYAQFVAAEQIDRAADDSDTVRAGLYLDLPVGVHPDGYDTWSQPGLFADAGVGAPPDAFFAGGQSWGFPPLHPQRLRESGYRYLIESCRQVFRHASAVRIDHVLGLQRLFWIPRGAGADAGAYVRYPHEELRAVIAIEAARAGVVVVGEDLGTVSPEIRRAMDRDGMLHTFVHRFDATPARPFPQPHTESMASLGSHDLPRFATWWRGSDIDERAATSELTPAAANQQRRRRRSLVTAVLKQAPGPSAAERRKLTADPEGEAALRTGLRACLGSLAGGPAAYLLVDLADLELDSVPDNRPGTGPEAGNWRHRLTRPLRTIARDHEVGDLITTIRDGRHSAVPKGRS